MSKQSNQSGFMGLILAVGLVMIVGIGAFIFMQQTDPSENTDNSSSLSDDARITSPGYNDSAPHSGSPNSRAGQKQGIGSRMVVGAVTAADVSSITIETSDGTSRTFTVTSSTEVLPGTQQAAQAYDPDNIEIGSTVAIGPNSSNSNQADTIALNYQTRSNNN